MLSYGNITSMIKRDCCVCLSKDHKKIYQRDFLDIKGIKDRIYHQQIDQCNKCGFIFANYGLSEPELKEYYGNISLYENYGLGKHASRFTNMSKRQFQFINEFLSDDHKKVLDVGCATGFNMVLYKNSGRDVIGFEPSEVCVKQGEKQFGVKVINDFFPSKKIPGKYDLIILSHVVEHTANPRKFLKAVRNYLNDSGLVFIEVPDTYSYIKLPGNSFTFEHINHFIVDTLMHLMEESGFHLIKFTIVNDSVNLPGTPAVSSLWEKNKYFVKNSQRTMNVEENKKMALSYVKKLLIEENNIKKQIKDLKKKIGNKKIALWGAGTTAASWMPFLKAEGVGIAYVFDIDPKKEGTLFNNIPVKKFDKKYLEEIEGILIASISEQNYIYEDLKDNLKIKNVYKFV